MAWKEDPLSLNSKQLPFNNQQRAALNRQIEMTYDLFWECLDVCFHNDDMEKYFDIWNSFPEQVKELYRRTRKRRYVVKRKVKMEADNVVKFDKQNIRQ